MNKDETAKALIKPWGYMFGGMSLIITTLFMLGWMIDQLTQTFGAEMPFMASVAPLLVTLTGVVWGGLFIWKGALSVDVSFDIFCKWADRILLNKMNRKARVLVGEPPLLAGSIILIIAAIQSAIRTGFFTTDTINLADAESPLWPIGIGLLIFGLIVTHGIHSRQHKKTVDGHCPE